MRQISILAPALVFWAASWGLDKDDLEEIRLIGPDGRVIAEATSTLERHKAQWFRFVGRSRPGAVWPRGRYRGEYTLYRMEDGRWVTVYETTREIEVH